MEFDQFKRHVAERDDVLHVKRTYLDARAQVRQRLYQQPDLRHLFFELTLNCNQRCYHCGSLCQPGAPTGLPAQVYAQVLDDVQRNFDMRRVQINITGGEPLLRPDFFEIMADVNQRGFRWGMTSNGTLITSDVAAKLARVGMGTISVSIDGLRDTHDELRGMPGGWDRAMRGIDCLLEQGSFQTVQVTTVVNHRSIDQLDALFDIFAGIDIDSWRVVGLEPIGRALQHPHLLLTDDDQRRLFAFILDKRREGLPVVYGCSHFVGPDLEGNVRDKLFLCNAGLFTASVRANGDICACLDIAASPQTTFGNVLQQPFSEVWNQRFELFRQPLSHRNETCRACEYATWCAGGAHHSWDYQNDVPLICLKDVLF